MPPKRKAAKRKAKASNGDSSAPKLPRADSENTQIRNAIASVKQETSSPKSKGKMDKIFLNIVGANKKPSIHGEYACMLNQTNVLDNNNKYYIIQAAKSQKTFYLFTRWGRVGEDGANKLEEFKTAEDAEKSFMKKFQDKTGNKWENRANFVAKNKKYTLLEMDDNSDVEPDDDCVDSVAPKVKKEIGNSSVKCSLDERTKIAIELLFNQSMFEDQMVRMDLDIRKMPLGKLSKIQIAKGFEALLELEEAVKVSESREKLAELSSKFFTLIPHNFGRSVPPLLASLNIIQGKKDVMMTLSDIELAQTLQDVKKELEDEHPLDINYKSLNCKLNRLNKKSKEFKLFQEYVKSTNGDSWRGLLKLTDAWEIDREGEAVRFDVNKNLGSRKLLWHGTSVAVVAAILNSGLRIMPHSGGRVGKGIYLASEYSKSAGYCGSYYNDFYGEKETTFMFLTEAALGKSHEIKKDDHTLKSSPKGFDSVVARGQMEPDPKKNIKLKIDGNDVIVPVGKPVDQKQWCDSHFDQSEYLVYNEHQVRLRYLLKFVV